MAVSVIECYITICVFSITLLCYFIISLHCDELEYTLACSRSIKELVKDQKRATMREPYTSMAKYVNQPIIRLGLLILLSKPADEMKNKVENFDKGMQDLRITSVWVRQNSGDYHK